MKSKITKIWGVGLTLVLATTMLLFPLPASAGTLSWGAETIPSTSGKVLVAGGNVTDLAVSGDGGVIYAAAGTSTIYRSSNGGESWTDITAVAKIATVPTQLNVDLIAVAPDDENYVAVAGSANSTVYITSDAGANWDSLGAALGSGAMADLAISMAKSGKHYVATAGDDGSSVAQISYYKIGAVGAAWTITTTGDKGSGWTTGDLAGAVAFSPNFASDEMMVAISGNASANSIDFQIFSFDQTEWNADAGFTAYPENLRVDAVTYTSFTGASIALSPDYLGSDDSMRLAFVGITVDGGASSAGKNSSLQRLEDDDAKVLKEKVHIYSVDYDGTNLVAGRRDNTTVYRSADPLASSPSVSGSAGLKSPGGVQDTVVAFAGSDVVAGTTGDESAFAVSENDGKTFNDISLIDTTLDTLSDVAVSPDGSNVYMSTANGTDDLSLWRYASRWERVLSVENNTVDISDVIIRTAPDDMDTVYVADAGGSTIYYSTDAGQNKWHTRISTETIVDLAVETDGNVAYVASALGYVSKSTNSGFTWASKKSSKLTGGISMLTSLGEDLLLAGSDDGKAAYSKDGNVSWSKIADDMTSGKVQVAAEGLDEGDLVVAGVNTVSDHLYRWDWDDEEWDEIADVPSSFGTYGIALNGGVLYSISANTTDSKLARSLNPTADDPSWNTVNSAAETFKAAPSALRVSVSDATVKLWALDTTAGAMDLFSYKDTIASVAPTLLAPMEGFGNSMNPISGKAFDVTFSWVRPSKKVTAYDFQVALDSSFNELALSQVLVDNGSTVGVVAGPTGSTITTDGVSYSFTIEYMPGTTYYWRVRVDAVTPASTAYGPIRSPWSEVRSFKVEKAEVTPPVTVAPTPDITVTIPPAPSVTLPAPEIIIPTPEIVLPAPQVTLPPSPAPVAPIPGWALYIIIIIGAILVIALIVLILRTRRPV